MFDTKRTEIKCLGVAYFGHVQLTIMRLYDTALLSCNELYMRNVTILNRLTTKQLMTLLQVPEDLLSLFDEETSEEVKYSTPIPKKVSSESNLLQNSILRRLLSLLQVQL